MKVFRLESASGRLRPEIGGKTLPDVERPRRGAAAGKRRRQGLMRWVSFATLVGPTVVAAVYFGLVVTPRYNPRPSSSSGAFKATARFLASRA